MPSYSASTTWRHLTWHECYYNHLVRIFSNRSYASQLQTFRPSVNNSLCGISEVSSSHKSTPRPSKLLSEEHAWDPGQGVFMQQSICTASCDNVHLQQQSMTHWWSWHTKMLLGKIENLSICPISQTTSNIMAMLLDQRSHPPRPLGFQSIRDPLKASIVVCSRFCMNVCTFAPASPSDNIVVALCLFSLLCQAIKQPLFLDNPPEPWLELNHKSTLFRVNRNHHLICLSHVILLRCPLLICCLFSCQPSSFWSDPPRCPLLIRSLRTGDDPWRPPREYIFLSFLRSCLKLAYLPWWSNCDQYDSLLIAFALHCTSGQQGCLKLIRGLHRRIFWLNTNSWYSITFQLVFALCNDLRKRVVVIVSWCGSFGLMRVAGDFEICLRKVIIF